MLLLDLSVPYKDPVIIFTIVLLVIFFAPLLLKKINVPGIIGLILAGAILGPKGFYILENDSSIKLFGKVGLLYIMFLAGLEIDLKEFKKSIGKSMVFGTLTFVIPMTVGIALAFYFLIGLLNIPITQEDFTHLALPASILLASMFASHTLLSYPIVSRYGLLKNEATTVTVGGTIITDTAALLVLAVIVSSTNGDLDQTFWITLGVSLLIYCIIVFGIFPIIARWFFRYVESEGVYQYIFTLAVVFSASMLAELAGIEAIIGAFCAGLALNRLIPHSSALMNRIEFVGNALFIPFFLISVGMLVDYRVLFEGPQALIVAAVMIFAANFSKYAAAFLTQKIFGYNKDERNLIFGLSNAQAAATLAVVIIAYDLGIFNSNVLNGTILMILVTCLVSSMVTEKAAKKLAVAEAEKDVELPEVKDRIMIPLANPENMGKLMDFAILLKDSKNKEPLIPLAIVKDSEEAQNQLVVAKRMLEKAMNHAAGSDTQVNIVARVDLNIAGGIIRAAKELFVTDLVIGWNGKASAQNYIFGSILDHVLKHTDITVFVSKIIYPVQTIKKIILAIPPKAHLEHGFQHWVLTIKRVAKQTGASIHAIAPADLHDILIKKFQKSSPSVDIKLKPFDEWEDFLILSKDITANDLFFVIKSRPGAISYDKSFDKIPNYLTKYFEEVSFVLVYPEQIQVTINPQHGLLTT